MIRRNTRYLTIILPVAVMLLLGCDTSPTDSDDENGDQEQTFGTTEDVQIARAIWSSIENYQNNWENFPGFEGWQEGNSPHGAWLKYYANPTAVNNPDQLPQGSVIIKENYPEQNEEQLGPVTVMVRIKDYDPDTYDWFWAKYLPDGSLDTNDQGVKLAGRVAKDAGGEGEHGACIGCHSGASGNDYMFAND